MEVAKSAPNPPRALAVAFDLLGNPVLRRQAGDRLAALVLADDARIATGFVGTPLICDALTDTGHLDVAYRLLTQTECPSWLYTVARPGLLHCRPV
ncbi:hypothetical protein [Actinophytocola glycyrrhizae]|uniref:Alpha-L-rhamnosidase six-hairpin glycosidase domain-containing protein n=1 Tax=Actinophytocola glycyrrhizae TaxID=2044873 RepID=A0ABV9S316_9PSEU